MTYPSGILPIVSDVCSQEFSCSLVSVVGLLSSAALLHLFFWLWAAWSKWVYAEGDLQNEPHMMTLNGETRYSWELPFRKHKTTSFQRRRMTSDSHLENHE